MPTKKRKRTPPKRRRASKKFTPPNVGPAFQKLVAVMSRLRAPKGCPWDREQTHSTLRTYLIEEAYEVLDALDSTDDAQFAEELGDLLLQVLFHAQIAHEENRFDISDVIREIYEKMIRRHPHVFGAIRAKTAAAVLRNWEQIKQQEREAKSAPVAQGESASKAAVDSARASSSLSVPEARQKLAQRASAGTMPRQTQAPEVRHNPTDPESVLDGVPRTLPALLEALQLTRKAARIGFDWYNLDGIFAKLQEETHELQDVLAKCRRGSLEAIGSRSRPAQAGFSSDNKQTNRKGAGRPGLQPGTRSAPEESASRIEGELGDILFVAVNLARFLNLDPEIALKKASSKFSRRFRAMEQFAREQGTTLAKIARPQMESLWDQAKLHEQSVPQK